MHLVELPDTTAEETAPFEDADSIEVAGLPPVTPSESFSTTSSLNIKTLRPRRLARTPALPSGGTLEAATSSTATLCCLLVLALRRRCIDFRCGAVPEDASSEDTVEELGEVARVLAIDA